MDVAATLVNYLDNVSDIPWYHNAPKNAPSEFGTLTRDGGPSEIVRDNPTITMLVYGETRGYAATNAYNARQKLLDAPYEVDGIMGAEILGEYYDPVDGKHRHRITASLIVND